MVLSGTFTAPFTFGATGDIKHGYEWTDPVIPTVSLATLQQAGYYSQVDFANAYRTAFLIEGLKRVENEVDETQAWIRNNDWIVEQVQEQGKYMGNTFRDLWAEVGKRAISDDVWKAIGDTNARIDSLQNQLNVATQNPTTDGGALAGITGGLAGFGLGTIALLGLGAFILFKVKK
jgi:hypothetical protein